VVLKRSHGWHEAKHDLRPWWNYFLGTLVAAYKEFEERVGTITTAKGAKRKMVQQAVERLPDQFTVKELRRACQGASQDMVRASCGSSKKNTSSPARATAQEPSGRFFC